MRLRRDAASDLGLGSAPVAQSLRPLFAGDETSLWRAPDGENYTVMVRLPVDDRTGVADLQRIWFTAGTEPNGLPRMVHIAQIADIVNDVGASQINRRDLNREVWITANVSGRSAGEVSSDLQKILADTKLPPGYRFVFGGSTKDMAESAAYAGQALLLAVILIYLILASQFGSFLQPIAIMMSLPMSLIGVFLGLLVAGTTLNIFSAIGFIMLMGLVTKNAILLVDFFNQARERGTPVNEALIEAGSIRLQAHPDDHARHGVRHDAAGARPGRRRQPARAHGACRDRRPDQLDPAHPGRRAGGAGLYRPRRPVDKEALQPLGRRARPQPQAGRIAGLIRPGTAPLP